MQVDNLLIFDQVKRKTYVIAYADLREETDLSVAYGKACDRIDTLVQRLKHPLNRTLIELTSQPNLASKKPVEFKSSVSQAQFCANVVKAKDYIKAGDIFQVVLSQRLSVPYEGDPFMLYRSLRLINPSPYMAFMNFKDWQIIGSSPEVMVKAERQADADAPLLATVRPIAGTRPRGKTFAEDQAYEKDLLQDPKEIAEHVMLVDLGRNDLGRVCINGSVQVEPEALMVIERYSHVMHIVSNVIGELAPGKTAWDLLKACFPAGTVSGAPKIRAMEIVHELEGCRRGPYSGVYGYYDFEGQLNSAITIRTMIVQKDGDRHKVSVQAGAGLVADSVPELEYEETLNKARGLLEAIRFLAQ
jgi:anthranilate synthase component 1